MILSTPIPFAEAIKSREVKAALPTSLSSADLAKLNERIKERAIFSARTTHAGYLQKTNDLVTRIANGELDNASARLELKQLLYELDYSPEKGFGAGDPDVPPAMQGSIRDLSSDARLNMILDTNTKMAQGYGHWAQGQDPAILEQWPAQELFRAEARGVERDWPERWAAAGGEFFDGGRMIALKNDPIWEAISEFNLPYPPFDYNSGMDVRDVSREEAVDMGLLGPDDQVEPMSRDFGDDTEASADQFDGWLQKAVADAGDYKLDEDGTLRLANSRGGWFAESINRVAGFFANGGPGSGRRKGAPLTEKKNIQRGQAALNRSLRQKADVQSAMYRSEVGDIDFQWGNTGDKSKDFDGGFGISHIQAKHPEALGSLVETLAKGKITAHESLDKKYVKHGDNLAVLRRRNNSRAHVVTSFEPKKMPSAKGRGLQDR